VAELMPRLTNRGFIFEADNKKNGKHLMMSGIPGDECIAKVQAIEKDIGLKLDFHHIMSMKAWVSKLCTHTKGFETTHCLLSLSWTTFTNPKH
jgi:hypothetical protein